MRVAAFLGFVAIAACGSSYTGSDAPDAGPQAGARLGVCYGNGTCNPGLSCIDSVCVLVGDAGSSTSGSIADAGADAHPKPDTCPQPPLPVQPDGIGCNFSGDATLATICDYSHVCCQATTPAIAWSCQGACGVNALYCDTPNDCNGNACCFQVTTSQFACPSFAVNRSACSAACNSGDIQACSPSAKCPIGTTCKSAVVRLDGTINLLGLLACIPDNQ